jgi:hypothetical protein
MASSHWWLFLQNLKNVKIIGGATRVVEVILREHRDFIAALYSRRVSFIMFDITFCERVPR